MVSSSAVSRSTVFSSRRRAGGVRCRSRRSCRLCRRDVAWAVARWFGIGGLLFGEGFWGGGLLTVATRLVTGGGDAPRQ
jgi:hypothetical protein